MSFQAELEQLGACQAAIEWVGDRDAGTAWRECQRADWMLWFMAKKKVDRRVLVLAACACAETALPYVKRGDDRPRKAIETARAWTRGEARLDEVKVAAAADTAAAADAAAAAPARAWLNDRLSSYLDALLDGRSEPAPLVDGEDAS